MTTAKHTPTARGRQRTVFLQSIFQLISGHDPVNHLNNRPIKAERYRHTDNDFVSIKVRISLAHRSSRTPLKNRCLTFPSADFARYSISALTSAQPRYPCARCAWRKAGFSGSGASDVCANRRQTSCRSHGRPFRHRPGWRPFAGLGLRGCVIQPLNLLTF